MTGFIGTSLQLQLIIIAHNQWLSPTRSIPCWTRSVFFSTVIHSVLIYESVTSWGSIVRWLTLHSWTLNYWTAFGILLRMTSVWRITPTNELRLFYDFQAPGI
jgi:hypothetical protein